MGKVLAFQLAEEASQKVKYIAGNLKLAIEEVPVRRFKQTLGEIAEKENREVASEYQGEAPEGSLLVFCDLEEKKLDKALAAIRQNQVEVAYKAILTPTNRKWNVLRLYAELEREKRSYEKSTEMKKGYGK